MQRLKKCIPISKIWRRIQYLFTGNKWVNHDVMQIEECSPAIKNNRKICATHTMLLRNPGDEAGARTVLLLSRKGRRERGKDGGREGEKHLND